MFPTRYTDLGDLRQKYGTRADKVAAYFFQTDPLADALVTLFASLPRARAQKMLDLALSNGVAAVPQAPPPLLAFFAHVEEEPPWLDTDLLRIGSRTFQRCGFLCSLVLGCCCLPVAYRSGAGTKPLVHTGTLEQRTFRRLSETNRFFLEACKPVGLRRPNPGWTLTVRVRLMHAHIRRLLRQSATKPWREREWGAPINQVDLAGTQTLFCVSLLRHLRQLGFHFTAEESAGVMHLWRYVGYLLGVAPELLCASEVEGRGLQELLLDITGEPDPDSQRLTRSLLETALPKMSLSLLSVMIPEGVLRRKVKGRQRASRLRHSLSRLLGLGPETSMPHLAAMSYGLSHGILGGRVAADLSYPRTHWRYTAPLLLRSLIAPLETCRRFVPGGTRLAVWLGDSYIERLMSIEMFARFPTLRPPK